jgi:chloride channel protein, CIC family
MVAVEVERSGIAATLSVAVPSPAATRLKTLSVKLGFDRDWHLVLIAAVIGLVMGGVATGFILPLRWIEQWAEHAEPRLLMWLIPTAPIIGALLASLVGQTLQRGESVPGVSTVIYAVHRKKSRIPLITAIRKWISSTLTIGSGGSAGAEGPIVTIGASIGSTIARWMRIDVQNTATLLGCGAAAGIASVFNAPIAGVFFVMEILLRDFSLRTFTPIVIASVVSSAWTRTILGSEAPLFLVDPTFFRDGYRFTVIDMPNYFLLGIACGLVAVAFIRALITTEAIFARMKAPALIKPAIGAAILGIIGLLYIFIFTPNNLLPPFYGNGYPVIRNLMLPSFYVEYGEARGVLLLIVVLGVLIILKCLATVLTIGSGGSGGLFAPSLLIGAAVGGFFGQIVNSIGLFPAASPAHYALVGMAAMIAATSHAPLTGILLVYEVTLKYEIILPLMLTAVISTIVGRLLYKESVYTFKLAQLGIRIGAMSDLTILRRLYVHDVPLVPAVLVHTHDRAQKLLELSEKHLSADFVVVDDRDQYVGMVTRDDLAAALVYREAIPLLQVHELQRSDLPTVTNDETLDVVLDKFSTHDAHSLPVMETTPNGGGKLVRGLITRSRLMERYQEALSKD